MTIAQDTPDWATDLTGAIDSIFPLTKLTLNDTHGNPVAARSITTYKSYQALIITLNPLNTSGKYGIDIAMADPASIVYADLSTDRSVVVSTSIRPVLKVPCTAGGAFTLQITGLVLNDQINVGVEGVVAPITSGFGLVRPDGRPYPIGQNAFTVNSTGSGNLITAPGAGKRIMLRTLDVIVVAGASSATYAIIGATVGGTVFNALIAGAPANGSNGKNQDYVSGLLLDDNTALTYASSISTPGAATYNGTYDIGS